MKMTSIRCQRPASRRLIAWRCPWVLPSWCVGFAWCTTAPVWCSCVCYTLTQTDALTPCVESMLSTTSWQQHHAAIRGVGIVAEACGHRLDPLLDSVRATCPCWLVVCDWAELNGCGCDYVGVTMQVVPFVLAKIVGPNPRLQHAVRRSC